MVEERLLYLNNDPTRATYQQILQQKAVIRIHLGVLIESLFNTDVLKAIRIL